MPDLVTRAQIDILAKTLGLEPDRLAYLQRLGADDVRVLGRRISDVLFDGQAATFAKIGRLAPLVPNSLVAKVAQAIIPPLVAGRASGALGIAHQGRIKDLFTRLSPQYMADCAPYLDPRTIAVLAPTVTGGMLIPPANELLRRGEYAVASQFLEHATPGLVRDFDRGITDDVGLLMTAALTPSTERLNDIIRMFSTERVERIVLASVASAETTLAGLSTLSRLDDDLQVRLCAVLFAAIDDAQLEEVLRVVVERGAHAEFLSLVPSLTPDVLDRIAAVTALGDPIVRTEFEAVAASSEMDSQLAALTSRMATPRAARATAKSTLKST